MTKAKTAGKTRAKTTPPAAASPARPRLAVPPEDIAGFRWLADDFGFPAICPQEECRRKKRCRGALTVPEEASDYAIPFCWAQTLDGLYGPVLRWHAFVRNLKNIQKAIAERNGEERR